MRPMYLVMVIGIFALATSCGGGDDAEDNAATKAGCEKLRDHIIDLRLVTASNVDVEAHRIAMRQALGDEFVANCTHNMTRQQVDCAIAAKDSQGAAACSQ